MPPLASAMTNVQKALLAALKTLLGGQSFLQALFTLWVRPAALEEEGRRAAAAAAGSRSSSPRGGKKKKKPAAAAATTRGVDEFLAEAEALFLGPTEGDGLARFAAQLKLEFRERLHAPDAESMLPSYNHLLPSGAETGRYVALDVGGSTLRVALVELRGRGTAAAAAAAGRESEIVRMDTFRITPEVKLLEGTAFFDWMAMRIKEVLEGDATWRPTPGVPIPLGLAWSFPVEQTAFGRGRLLGMGKGFLATRGLLGQDLGAVLEAACARAGLAVALGALVNDGAATLLSQAYGHAATRFGLILGTGTNAAVLLPVAALAPAKLGARPPAWRAAARRVIVNTELGMFGQRGLPRTRWDHRLRARHPRPDFQPLEHLLAGFYLGEVCRLALAEAVELGRAGEGGAVFGGVLPPSLETPYSLDTETLSRIAADPTPTFETALPYFASAHPSTPAPTPGDLAVLSALASLVTRRSAALLAASVFALWELRHETEAEAGLTDASSSWPAAAAADDDTMVAFNGSVIEHYPGYRARCQAHLDALVAASPHPGRIELVPALESSILGAAVALACVGGEVPDAAAAAA